MTNKEICGGCGLAPQGSASINNVPYCHPDKGLDCYHLATVYNWRALDGTPAPKQAVWGIQRHHTEHDVEFLIMRDGKWVATTGTQPDAEAVLLALYEREEKMALNIDKIIAGDRHLLTGWPPLWGPK